MCEKCTTGFGCWHGTYDSVVNQTQEPAEQNAVTQIFVPPNNGYTTYAASALIKCSSLSGAASSWRVRTNHVDTLAVQVPKRFENVLGGAVAPQNPSFYIEGRPSSCTHSQLAGCRLPHLHEEARGRLLGRLGGKKGSGKGALHPRRIKNIIRIESDRIMELYHFIWITRSLRIWRLTLVGPAFLSHPMQRRTSGWFSLLRTLQNQLWVSLNLRLWILTPALSFACRRRIAYMMCLGGE